MPRRAAAVLAAALLTAGATGEVRVQDIASLKGQHANRLFGFGLVVGLDGTGDGAQSPSTLRALAQLHRLYQAPVFDVRELEANNNVAIVSVEATVPEFGAREGQKLDVTVSALGPAKSLKGGQLLTTPLQEATLAAPYVLALAGGAIEVDAADNPQRGVIRNGGVLEEEFLYNFIEDGHITLVLHDAKAGFQWAHMLARSIDISQESFARPAGEENDPTRIVATPSIATAISPTSVRVRVPNQYLMNPAPFISSILTSIVIEEPKQRARVVINRRTNGISFTGSVSISPTVLQIPGLGTVAIGQGDTPAANLAGIDTEQLGGVRFQELLATLSRLQLSDEQMVAAVEQLHRTGTLHAELIYTE